METDFKITAPVLDMNVIQKAAQDAAMKAALEEVKDYYLGYNSPYRKQLKEYMAKNAPSTRLELPEFSELLSKSLTAEIENFVNKKCVESFAQALRKGFTHLKEEGDGTILLTNLAEDMMQKVVVNLINKSTMQNTTDIESKNSINDNLDNDIDDSKDDIKVDGKALSPEYGKRIIK